MNIKEKEELIKYLFPTSTARRFFVNDLYQELMLPIDKIYSDNNIILKNRKANYLFCYNFIDNFLKTNKNYKKIVKNIYKNSHSEIIKDILIGYCFYISQTKYDYDIFKDERSVCYSVVSIVDILDV